MEFREHVRQAIGCECQRQEPPGKVWVQDHDEFFNPVAGWANCPVEHVEVTLYDGTTIWADPTKTRWRCIMTYQKDKCDRRNQGKTREHNVCGPEPRWDVINQEQP